jgi:hypothetical protein
MRQLELSLFVNDRGLIEVRELKAEMGPDQDAGTWYGLQGKIVLRDMANPRRRSIILRLGDNVWARRQGVHVEVRVVDGGPAEYAKYDIDDNLGRLSCPPEPRLLYTKALCHALTSFCLPDPLTGRTGTEEAIHVLRSGAAQHWTELGVAPVRILHGFRDLLPRREFYPLYKKRFQTVTWDARFTTTIQHDSLDAVLCDIMNKSNRLAKFASNNHGGTSTTFASTITAEGGNDQVTAPTRSTHLRLRTNMRRCLYDRRWMEEGEGGDDNGKANDNLLYFGRGLPSRTTHQSRNISDVSRSLCRQPYRVDHRLKDIGSILEGWPRIGGFPSQDATRPTTAAAAKPAAAEVEAAVMAGPLVIRIEGSVSDRWGELVRFCQRSKSRASGLFRLGLLAFAPEAYMDAIHHLAPFASIGELRALEPPSYANVDFWNLGATGPPSVETLESVIATAYVSYEEPHPMPKRKAKQRARLEAARMQHQEMCEAEGRRMASLLLGQWPVRWPVLVGQQHVWGIRNIHIAIAPENLQPEWERRQNNGKLAGYFGRVQAILNRHKAYEVDPDEHNLASATADTPATYNDYFFHSNSYSQKEVIPRVASELVIKPGPVGFCFSPSPSSFSFSYLDATSHNPTAAELFRFCDEDRTGRPQTDLRATSHLFAELTDILNRCEGSADSLRRQYGRDLLQSLAALREKTRTESAAKAEAGAMENEFGVPELASLDSAVDRARVAMGDLGSQPSAALAADDGRFHWLELGGLWPCASTPVSLLRLLRSRSSHRFGPGMKEALVAYGLAVAHLQRLERLRVAVCQDDQRVVDEELRNPGHENWDPMEHADWLLMELDGNFLIRAEQVDVALPIVAPPSERNSVLQMNMGKGKTSCIVPMAVAALADGENLARLVVPKPLLL